MIELIKELGVPFAGVIIVVVVALREFLHTNDAQDRAVVQLQSSIVEGLREDLVRATNEARAAREEAQASRLDAEREREARRKVEDEHYAYRMNARVWLAQLVAQLRAANIAPAEPPSGFEV